MIVAPTPASVPTFVLPLPGPVACPEKIAATRLPALKPYEVSLLPPAVALRPVAVVNSAVADDPLPQANWSAVVLFWAQGAATAGSNYDRGSFSCSST